MKSIEWEELKPPDDDAVMDDDEDGVKYGTVLDTGTGLFLLNDMLHPFRQYKFWIAHTTFWITEDHFDSLKFLEGVEVVKVLSPYRFMLAPAKLFDHEKVKKAVENCLGIFSNEMSRIIGGIDDLKRELMSTCKEWAIYVFPNGEYEYVTSDNPEYKNRIKLFEEYESLSSGMIITHDMEDGSASTLMG